MLHTNTLARVVRSHSAFRALGDTFKGFPKTPCCSDLCVVCVTPEGEAKQRRVERLSGKRDGDGRQRVPSEPGEEDDATRLRTRSECENRTSPLGGGLLRLFPLPSPTVDLLPSFQRINFVTATATQGHTQNTQKDKGCGNRVLL